MSMNKFMPELPQVRPGRQSNWPTSDAPPQLTRRLLFSGLLSLLFVLGACSPGTGAGSATVNVRGSDFAFSSDKVSVPAGNVHFVFSNQSTTNPHELWVYPQNQPRLQEMVRAKESGQDVEEKDYMQNIAGVEDVKVGQTESFDVTLQPGAYELGCFITMAADGQQRNHYTMGMHIPFTVTAK
jgi:plastocyanin